MSPPRLSLSSASRGVLSTVAVNLAIMAIGLLTGVLTARGLEPADRGAFLAVLLWSGLIAGYAVWGLDQAMIYASEGTWARALAARTVVSRRVQLQALVATVLAVLVNLLLLGSLSFSAWTTATLGAAAVPLTAATQLRLSPLLAAGRLRAWNITRISSPVSYALLLAILVALDALTVAGSLAALALSSLVTYLVAYHQSRRPLVSNLPEVDGRSLVRYGHQIVLVGLPSYLASRIDQLLMGIFLAPAVLGVYAVAVSVASVVEVIKLTVEQLLFPRYVRTGWVRADVRLTALIATLITGLVGVGAVPLLRPAIGLVYGADYVGAVNPLPWLMLAVGLRVGIAILTAALKASGSLPVVLMAATLGLVTSGAAMALLLPPWGDVGAAVAVLCGQAVNWSLLFFRLGVSHTARPATVVASDV